MTDRVDTRLRRIADWVERFIHQPDLEISGTVKPRMLQPGFYEALPAIADAVPGAFARTADGAYVATATEWVLIGSAELSEAAIIAALGYTPADVATTQPLDSDLTTIAGLAATTNNIIQSVASAWASRTPAQLKATLGLVKGDVGLGNVDNTSDATKDVAVATLSNKTLTTPAISATGFTNATHAHAAANSGGQIPHGNLTSIGTNTHAQIDTHLAATAAHGASGAVVGTTNTQTLTDKTLTTPTISATGFTNAQHAHAAANSGGTLNAAAIAAGTLATARLGSGTADSTKYLRGDSTWQDFAHTHAPTVTQRSNSAVINAGATGAVSVSCLAGEVMTGGGGGFVPVADTRKLVRSYPSAATTWTADGSNTGGGIATLFVYAVCLTTPI